MPVNDQVRFVYSSDKCRFQNTSEEYRSTSAALARKKKKANWFIKKDPMFINFVAYCEQAKVTPTLWRLLAYIETLESDMKIEFEQRSSKHEGVY